MKEASGSAASSHLREKLRRLPRAPGVYIMRGEGGEALYVGKASDLRARVRSYFAAGSSDTRFFVSLLAEKLRDVETVCTADEREALLLENSLIKSLRPRYNVRLRDDKEYLSIRIDLRAEWPRIELVRRPKSDGARYFGPFDSASAARETVRVLGRIFRLRPCRDSAMRGRRRACLQHSIRRCDGPCVGLADARAYRTAVQRVVALLEGRLERVSEEIGAEMRAASKAMRYERAAELRDQMAAIERTGLGRPQRVVEVSPLDRDVVGLWRDGPVVEVVVLEVRAGRVVFCRAHAYRGVEADDAELIGAFLTRRYAEGATVPNEIVVPVEISERAVLEAFLGAARGGRVRIVVPRRGRLRALLDMAQTNARQRFVEEARDRESAEAQAEALARALRLARPPHVIECVDVSHWGGHAEREATVAAVVALRHGVPAKERYRRFRIRRDPGGDDYAAMREVLRRRFARVRSGDPKWAPPDLLVVDGGRGHLAVARTVLGDLGVRDVDVAAVAKGVRREGRPAPDAVYVADRKNPVLVRPGSSALHLIARVRDEAHRFALGYQEKVRSTRRLRDRLAEVPGIGPVARRRLLAAFGSVARVRDASLDDLRAVEGMTEGQARAIYETLHR